MLMRSSVLLIVYSNMPQINVQATKPCYFVFGYDRAILKFIGTLIFKNF